MQRYFSPAHLQSGARPGPTQPTYFGFSFDSPGHLIVSELFATSTTIPAAGASAVSSFAIAPNGDLRRISASVANGQSLSCWVVVDPLTSHYAFIGNNGSSDISTYTIAPDGSLTLLNPVAASASSPNDLAIAVDGTNQFLYALNAANGTVGAWKINADGSLTPLAIPAGLLPAGAGAQGLAAY